MASLSMSASASLGPNVHCPRGAHASPYPGIFLCSEGRVLQSRERAATFRTRSLPADAGSVTRCKGRLAVEHGRADRSDCAAAAVQGAESTQSGGPLIPRPTMVLHVKPNQRRPWRLIRAFPFAMMLRRAAGSVRPFLSRSTDRKKAA